MDTTVAGRYRPLRELGRGAAGAVWLCEDQVLRREVAVKQVGRLPGESTHDVARALREARSSAALQHPGVVTVFDVVEEDDTTWLVMEHVPSRPLSQVVADDGPLPPRRVAALLAPVAGGLAAAHREGTVHRDVKPGNVLVTDAGVAKISDFGIARTGGDDQLTRSGMVVGTPAYFSPELARGEDPSPASDVWALGATAYAAVEGHPPFPSHDNPLAMLAEIARSTAPRPERAGPLTPVLARMLDPDPAQRLSMAEAEQAFLDVAAGRGRAGDEPTVAVAAPPPTAPTAPLTPTGVEPRPEPVADPAPAAYAVAQPEPAPRRRRWLLPVLAAVVLLALLGWGLSTVLGDDADAPATTAGEDTSASPSPSASEDTGDEPSPEPETTEPAPEPETTEPEPETEPETEAPPAGSGGDGAASAGSAAAFVEDYYSLLPSDPRSAWPLLGPQVQAEVGSVEDYEAFWRTIDAVEVTGTESEGDGVVLVSLRYTTDGSSQTEQRRLGVEQREGDRFVVATDEGPV
ncbi:protein kinase domain-containing protein [Nocardioides perillae]|uniref:non-specific serine/threonine protein kinase n=1 Tax=Nocardioides perillae TaxID=1119534 RepID=A0A7Y9UNQ2_9ACTN|nr:hypothetical protein [Nocardioides perillae]